MIGKLFRFIKSCGRVYAHIVVNALFPLSLCWSVNIVELAFEYHHLSEILTYLGIALIPLYLWRLIYFVSFNKNSKLFVFRNFDQNNISWFGLVCATVTIISIFRDSYLLYYENLEMIPAGIIGKYLDFLFQPELLSWSTISFWLVLRYLLIILSFYPYIININNLFNWQSFSIADYQIKSNKANSPNNSPQNRKTSSNQNNHHTKNPRRRRKMHGKKLTYIE